MALRRRLGDKQALAQSLRHLGSLTFDRGDLEVTKRYYEESAVHSARVVNLGEVRMMQNKLEEAEEMLKESFVLFQEIGSQLEPAPRWR